MSRAGIPASLYQSTKKGLINLAGQNNCFLNVGIQALWHLEVFRHRFLAWETHKHDSIEACAHCALKTIFTQYSFSDESNIPPSALREALHIIYRSESRFQIGDVDDAAESLEAILSCLLRSHLAGLGDTPPSPAVLDLLPSRAFELEIKEVLDCQKCHTRTEAPGSHHYIYYTYVEALRNLHARYPRQNWEAFLRTVGHQDFKSCSNEQHCNEKIRVQKVVERHPDVFMLGLVWPTTEPEPAEIASFLQIIATDLDLSQVFPPHRVRSRHQLRGMICYYGKHYDAYFYSKSRRSWMVFDDTTVRSIGMNWTDVIDRCRRGHFHPSVLFYEVDRSFVPPSMPAAISAPVAAPTTVAVAAPTAAAPPLAVVAAAAAPVVASASRDATVPGVPIAVPASVAAAVPSVPVASVPVNVIPSPSPSPSSSSSPSPSVAASTTTAPAVIPPPGFQPISLTTAYPYPTATKSNSGTITTGTTQCVPSVASSPLPAISAVPNNSTAMGVMNSYSVEQPTPTTNVGVTYPTIAYPGTFPYPVYVQRPTYVQPTTPTYIYTPVIMYNQPFYKR